MTSTKFFATSVVGAAALLGGIFFVCHQMESHTINFSDVNTASVIYGEDGRIDSYEVNFKGACRINRIVTVNRRTYNALTNGTLTGKKFTLKHTLLNVTKFDYELDQSHIATTKLN